jgi:hypothetical protein
MDFAITAEYDQVQRHEWQSTIRTANSMAMKEASSQHTSERLATFAHHAHSSSSFPLPAFQKLVKLVSRLTCSHILPCIKRLGRVYDMFAQFPIRLMED